MDSVLGIIQKNQLEYKHSGQDYLIKCLNPEHPDKNPSLRIDKLSGAFHCFSCGYKGNLFKFYGVFANPTPIKIAKLKEKINEVKSATTGLDPIKDSVPMTRSFRSISAKTLQQFGAFYTTSEQDLANRLCFPIKDIRGKTAVYVCRHMFSDENPRYVNYPRNVKIPLFPPSAPIGYKNIILVEGLFDMLNMHEHGMINTVATFGTNTLQNNTKEKLMPFKAQGIEKVYILYDGDQPGNKAAEMLKPLIEECGFLVEIITLPDGEDPGSLDRENLLSIKEYING